MEHIKFGERQMPGTDEEAIEALQKYFALSDIEKILLPTYYQIKRKGGSVGVTDAFMDVLDYLLLLSRRIA